MPSNETLTALQQASAGLTYPSETDAPFSAFAWPDATGEPTAVAVRQKGGHKGSAPAKEGSVEDLFAPLLQEQDWYGDEEKADLAKYRQLRDTVKRLLGTPKVFRVGERKATIYVVGQAKEGGWAGVKTTAVET